MSFVVLSHSVQGTTGFPDAFVDHLNEQKLSVTHVRFPFFLASDPRIHTQKWIKGKMVAEDKSWISFYKPNSLAYLKDMIWLMCNSFRIFRKDDAVLVTNCLLGIVSLFFLKIGYISKLYYLVIDYSPRRFQNPIFEYLYRWMDRSVAYGCTQVWTMSDTMLKQRELDGHLRIDRLSYRITPVGNHSHILSRQTIPYNRFRLVYVGNPNAKNVRADLLLDCLKILRATDKRYELVFVGPGDTSLLKAQSKELGLEDSTTFKGLIPSAIELEVFMSHGGIGMAPYDPYLEGNFSRFADPAKIKTYLGSSLPVITSEVPPNALELQRSGAGLIAKFSPEDFSQKVLAVSKDHSEYLRFRNAASKMGLTYSWLSLFSKILSEEKLT